MVTPYGRWPSPITADIVARSSTTYDAVQTCGESVYWLESRPSEGGRTALVRWRPGGLPRDVLPPTFDVGTWVNEYGGGAYAPTSSGLFVCNSKDDRVYRVGEDGSPIPITPATTDRYADLQFVPGLNVLLSVRERHVDGSVVSDLAAIPADGDSAPWSVAGEHDFLASPRPSPDGKALAWLTADRPNMPWDGSRLWLASLTPDGRVGPARVVAGGDGESIFQPEWSPAGDLHFVSDRSGWWNLYRLRDGEVEALMPIEAEFGEAQWEFGYSTFAFLDEHRIACRYRIGVTDRLAMLDEAAGTLADLTTPVTSVKPYVRAACGRVALIGASPTVAPSVMAYDLSNGNLERLTTPGDPVDERYISSPEHIAYQTTDGRQAYALYYPPRNPDIVLPPGERPPLIVVPHPGPTTDAKPRLDLRIQFFTSRGFAVVAVNYRGSTGYGRRYREELAGRWGVVDAEDCVSAARYLIAARGIDPMRIVISGASAGGFSALNAAAASDVFAAAVSTFGITDLETHLRQSPRFQAFKLERLVGSYASNPEEYRRRSPVHRASSISCPVLLLHGTLDSVVPPEHSRAMATALRRAGVPCTLLEFEDEGHVFRKADNIRRSLEVELSFVTSALKLPAGD